MATRDYTGEEVKEAVVRFLTEQAELWREDASREDKLASANRPKMDTLRWGADRLDAMASQIKRLPKGVELEAAIDEGSVAVDDGVEPASVSTPQTEVEDLGAPQNPEGGEDLAMDDFARTHAEVEDVTFEAGELDAESHDEDEGKSSDEVEFVEAQKPKRNKRS